MKEKEFPVEKKSSIKKKRVYIMLIVFAVLMAGYFFFQANPHFKSPISIFSSYGFSEIYSREIKDLNSISGDIEGEAVVELKQIVSLKDDKWIIHLNHNYQEKILLLDGELSELKSIKIDAESILRVNKEKGKWFVLNPGVDLSIFDADGKQVAKIELDNKEKISSDNSNIILGDNELKTEEGLLYVEKVSWYNYRGEKIKNREIKNSIILEGRMREDFVTYLGLDFSETPMVKLLEKPKLENDETQGDETQGDEELVDLRLDENSDVYMEYKDELLVIGSERELAFKKGDLERFYKLDTGGIINDTILLDDKTFVILIEHEIDEETKEFEVLLLGLDQGELEVILERSIRGNPLDIITRSRDNKNEFVIATTSHIYEFQADEFVINNSPWKDGVEACGIDEEGEYILIYDEALEELKLYEKIKDDKDK